MFYSSPTQLSFPPDGGRTVRADWGAPCPPTLVPSCYVGLIVRLA
jgi:hypothetical protein